MTYIWLLSPLNNSYLNIAGNLINFIIGFLFPRIFEILATPIINPELLWIVSPLIIASILMILYFGRYRHEELGWNTAFSNNIILIFVSVNLVQQLAGNGALLSGKAMFIYGLLIYNFIQLLINYFHLVPKGISFLINSTVPTNFLNYFAIILVYSNIPLDITTIIASVVLLILLYILSQLALVLVPMSKGSKIFIGIMKKKEEKIEKREQMRMKRNENLHLDEYKPTIILIGVFLIIYIALFLINKLIINISEYYLIIISAFFIVSTIIFVKIKKLSIRNLLISDNPLKKDIGIFAGIGLFVYYVVASNIFVYVIEVPNYSPNIYLLITSILLVSISAEFFFRGIIQRGLKIKHNKLISVSIQALLWSLLKADVFLVTFLTIPNALIGLLLVYPVGLLLGYIKERGHLDSTISASLIMGIFSIIFLLF